LQTLSEPYENLNRKIIRFFNSKRFERIEARSGSVFIEAKSDERINPSIPLALAKQKMLNQPRFLSVGDAGGDSSSGILRTKGEKK